MFLSPLIHLQGTSSMVGCIPAAAGKGLMFCPFLEDDLPKHKTYFLGLSSWNELHKTLRFCWGLFGMPNEQSHQLREPNVSLSICLFHLHQCLPDDPGISPVTFISDLIWKKICWSTTLVFGSACPDDLQQGNRHGGSIPALNLISCSFFRAHHADVLGWVFWYPIHTDADGINRVDHGSS
jgi:hypothetical protein